MNVRLEGVEQDLKIVLYNLAGKKLFEKKHTGIIPFIERIDCRGYGSGIYILDIQFEGYRTKEKIMLVN